MVQGTTENPVTLEITLPLSPIELEPLWVCHTFSLKLKVDLAFLSSSV